MTRHEKRLQDLITVAEGLSEFNRHKHAAAIYIGNRLVAVGVNKMKSHPLQAKFGINHEAIYLHAEIDAIVNALKKVSPLDLKHATLYVAKSKNGLPKNSKPCAGCAKAIMHFDIPNVHWTT